MISPSLFLDQKDIATQIKSSYKDDENFLGLMFIYDDNIFGIDNNIELIFSKKSKICNKKNGKKLTIAEKTALSIDILNKIYENPPGKIIDIGYRKYELLLRSLMGTLFSVPTLLVFYKVLSEYYIDGYYISKD
jgi:hypothetical protein